MSKFRLTVTLPMAFALLAAAAAADAAQPQQAAPQGEDPPVEENGAASPAPEHDGVIVPPDIGDEDIHTDAPDPEAGHEKEVIPPSGTESGTPDVEPR